MSEVGSRVRGVLDRLAGEAADGLRREPREFDVAERPDWEWKTSYGAIDARGWGRY